MSSARPSASIRMALPAPVSPVRAPRLLSEPREKARSSFSIRTKSRIESETNMYGRSEEAEEPAAIFVLRPRALAGHQEIGVLIPVAAREVVAEHSGGLLRLLLDPERQGALDQAVQRLRHL